MTTAPIVWIHADCLSPDHPGWIAHPDAPALFVWDDALLTEWQISLKRIVFIYECLLELPVTIRRGDVAAQVAAFAAEHGTTHVVTAASPSPRFRQLVSTLRRAGLRVEVLPVEPFFEHSGSLDLARFSRYWGTAKRYVLDDE